MNYTALVKTALKAKAPVVAIPVEGRAPVCVKSSVLKGALKGVDITSVEVVKLPDVETFTPAGSTWVYEANVYDSVKHEGPPNRRVTPGERRLKILGTAGRVRTSCTIVPLHRNAALKLIGDWTEKERKSLERKRYLVAAPKKLTQTAKALEYALDGEDAITVTLRGDGRNGKSTFEVKAVPVSLASAPTMSFALYKSGNEFRVAERTAGFLAGSGKTAKLAIEAAEIAFTKATPAERERVMRQVAENQLQEEVAA